MHFADKSIADKRTVVDTIFTSSAQKLKDWQAKIVSIKLQQQMHDYMGRKDESQATLDMLEKEIAQKNEEQAGIQRASDSVAVKTSEDAKKKMDDDWHKKSALTSEEKDKITEEVKACHSVYGAILEAEKQLYKFCLANKD